VVGRVVLDPDHDADVHAAEDFGCIAGPEALEVQVRNKLDELLLRPPDRLLREGGVHQEVEVRSVRGPCNDDAPRQHRVARSLACTVLDAVDVAVVGACRQDLELGLRDVGEVEDVGQVSVVVRLVPATATVRLAERLGERVPFRFRVGLLLCALRRAAERLGGVATLLLLGLRHDSLYPSVWCFRHR